MSSPEQKLGQKLLEGWTMLNDICPECSIPLMRKDGTTLCVGCNKRIITQEDIQRNTSKKLEEQWSKSQDKCQFCQIQLMEKNSQTYCPACENIVKKASQKAPQKEVQSKPAQERPENEQEIHQRVKQVILDKIQFLCDKLEVTEHPKDIKLILKTLESCYENLKYLN